MNSVQFGLVRRASRSAFRWSIVLICVGAILSTLLPQRASATAEGMEFGARVEARGGEDSRGAVQRMETAVGRELDVVREFLSWDSPFPDTYHTWVRDSGRTMILSVKSKRANGAIVRWADIAAATPGSAIHNDVVEWADDLREYGVPIYFAFNHEPESKASSTLGGAANYIAAWRKIHGIFAERGATNVKFMWIMTDYSFFVGSQAPNDASKWYPGDPYLDAMGADAYNWYTCRSGINTPWWTLEHIIRPFRDFGAAHPDKELWLSEYASTEDTARPGRKAQWLGEAQALFKRPDYSQFRGIVYFDFRGPDSCQWYVNSSSTSSQAFRAIGQDGFYGGPIDPPPPPEPSEISFVAAGSSNGNRSSHAVQVPSSVQAGDTLLLFFTANQNPATTTPPSGWTTVRTAEASGFSSRLWFRTATALDAGSTLTVSTSAISKSDLKVVAYRGTGSTPLDVHAVAVDTSSRTQYTAPSVAPTQDGDEIIVYWGDKSSTNTGHTVPSQLTKLAPTTTGSGSGYITATIAGMSAGSAGIPTGTFTATFSAAAGRVVMYTVALRPVN